MKTLSYRLRAPQTEWEGLVGTGDVTLQRFLSRGGTTPPPPPTATCLALGHQRDRRDSVPALGLGLKSPCMPALTPFWNLGAAT